MVLFYCYLEIFILRGIESLGHSIEREKRRGIPGDDLHLLKGCLVTPELIILCIGGGRKLTPSRGLTLPCLLCVVMVG